MPEYVEAIEKLMRDNPNLGKSALVQLLTARFPKLNRSEAWNLVAHNCNEKRVAEHLKRKHYEV